MRLCGKVQYGLAGRGVSALLPAKTRHQGRVKTAACRILRTSLRHTGLNRARLNDRVAAVSTRPIWLRQLPCRRADTPRPLLWPNLSFIENRIHEIFSTGFMKPIISGHETKLRLRHLRYDLSPGMRLKIVEKISPFGRSLRSPLPALSRACSRSTTTAPLNALAMDSSGA